jgi:ABC-type thiamin/hydroxymethylpyrimidine transport system permease subunit
MEAMMSRTDIITILFGMIMAANVIALVRHWRMMRVLNFMLSGLIETQRQFNEIIELDRARRS